MRVRGRDAMPIATTEQVVSTGFATYPEQPDMYDIKAHRMAYKLGSAARTFSEIIGNIKQHPIRSSAVVVVMGSLITPAVANATAPSQPIAASERGSVLTGNNSDGTEVVRGTVTELSATAWGSAQWVWNCLAKAENEATPATQFADPGSICMRGFMKRTKKNKKPIGSAELNLACPTNPGMNTTTTVKIYKPKTFVKAVAKIDVGKTKALANELSKIKWKVGTKLRGCNLVVPTAEPKPEPTNSVSPSPSTSPSTSPSPTETPKPPTVLNISGWTAWHLKENSDGAWNEVTATSNGAEVSFDTPTIDGNCAITESYVKEDNDPKKAVQAIHVRPFSNTTGICTLATKAFAGELVKPYTGKIEVVPNTWVSTVQEQLDELEEAA